MSGPHDPHPPLHDQQQRLAELLLTLAPADGSFIDNAALWRAIGARLATAGQPATPGTIGRYWPPWSPRECWSRAKAAADRSAGPRRSAPRRMLFPHHRRPIPT